MNKGIHLKRKIVFIGLCIGVVLCWVQPSLAQFDRVSVTVSGGAGYLPLKDWKDFAADILPSYYDQDKFGSYLDFRLSYNFTNKHSIVLNVEDIKTFASLSSVEILTNELGDTTGFGFSVTEWEFSAIPIGLSYEFHPMRSEEKVSPFIGAGASYFFSEVRGKLFHLYNSPFKNTLKGTRDGKGYGVHVYVGVQSQLTEHLIVVSRLRGQYADGMAFTDKKGDIKVEFTGVDFTLGLGWRF